MSFALSGSYGSQLMQRVLEMAEGIDVGEMPSYELVSSAEAKKRPNSSNGSKSKCCCFDLFCAVLSFSRFGHVFLIEHAQMGGR